MTVASTKKSPAEKPASALIDERIASLGGDWRAETFTRVRAIIHEVEPAIVEEWKWMGTPIFSRAGIVCTGETYKQVVKLTFAKGASLPDPKKLFNSSLDGNVRRAIDIREGEKLDVPALKALLRAAIALNVANEARKAKPKAVTAPVAKKAVAKKAVAKKVGEAGARKTRSRG